MITLIKEKILNYLFINKNHFVLYSIVLTILAVVLSAIFFAYVNHSSYIRADQWRFIELYLEAFNNGTFELKMLWSDHHPQPLTGFLFLASASLFDLTVNLYFYVGIFGKILFLFFLIFLIHKSINTTLAKYLLILIVVTTWLSLKSMNEYSWPLVTLGNIWLFIILINLYMVDIIWKSSDYSYKFSLLLFITLILLFIGTKDLMTIYIGSVVPVILLVSIRDHNYKKLLYLLFIILLAFIVYKIFWYLLNIEQVLDNEVEFQNNSFRFIDIISSYAIALLSGLVDFKILRDFGFLDIWLMGLGYIYLFFYIAIFVYYIKAKKYQKSLFPIVLMTFSIVFATAVILFRYFPETGEINWFVASPRYIKLYEIGTIGFFWAIFIILDNFFKNLTINFIAVLISCFLVILNLYYINNSWNRSKYIVNYHLKIENLLQSIQTENDLPKKRMGSHFSYEKIIFLKNNKLNVYNDNYTKIDRR